jgi:hypothetical protein
VQLAREIGALQQQVAALAQMVASTTTISVEPIKDETGRIIGEDYVGDGHNRDDHFSDDPAVRRGTAAQ